MLNTCNTPENAGRQRKNMRKVFLVTISVGFLAQAQSNNSTSGDRITPAHVWSAIQPYLISAGDRFYKPGNERISGTGTISRGDPGKVVATSVQVTWEFPGKIRLEDGGVSSTFNPSAPNPSGKSSSVSDTLETLVEDTFDGFLSAHAGDSSTRVIGKGFQWQGHPGQFVDIVQVTSQSKVKGNSILTNKEYRFDSRTKLLVMVSYLSATKAQVEIIFSNWQNVQGQMVPKSIIRNENGVMVFALNLTTLTVGAKINDGKFDN